jgi:outer membrane protein assembly factor BamB
MMMAIAMNGSGKYLLGLAASLAVLAATARGDDWPQWLGPERDGVWRETGVIDKFPAAGPKVRWRVPIGPGYGGPAVAHGRVYVMDRMLAKGASNPKNLMKTGNIPGTERILCLNASDGSIIWKHEYDCPYTISYPTGPRTTPTVQSNRVYTLGAQGNLLCLDADTGKPEWSHDLKKEYGAKPPFWGFSSSLLLDGQRVISMVGGKGHAVVAFDKDSGKQLWQALDSPNAGYCPPMIYEFAGKRQLITWDPIAVSALDPETGHVNWSQPIATYSGMSISTPRKAGDSLFLTGYANIAILLHLQADKADVAWKASKKTGLYSVFSTPFVEDGYVYGAHTDGKLACIKLDTGERVWETMAPNNGKKAPSGDPFLIKNGGRFFIANEKGDLIIARLTPKAYEEISRAHVLAPTTFAFGDRDVVWSHPAFADRCAFMRNDKEIACVSLSTNEK